MKLYLISAVFATLVCAVWGQTSEGSAKDATSMHGPDWRSRSWRSGMARRYPGFHDSVTTGGGMQFRQSFMEEMRHVPKLESKLQRLMRIQQEKHVIRQKLEETARQTNRPSSALLKDFHDLLARQDELTSRQAEIGAEFRKDAEAIQDGLVARRNEISARLEQLRRTGSDKPEQRNESRTQGRQLRMYDVLIERMSAVRDTQPESDWLLSFLRGMHLPIEGLDPGVIEQAREHLQQLEQDCDELRDRVRTVEDQIDELRELLDIADRPPLRRGGRGSDRSLRPGSQGSRRRATQEPEAAEAVSPEKTVPRDLVTSDTP